MAASAAGSSGSLRKLSSDELAAWHHDGYLVRKQLIVPWMAAFLAI
jgi:hypothetical protein